MYDTSILEYLIMVEVWANWEPLWWRDMMLLCFIDNHCHTWNIENDTLWESSVFGVILVCVFSHSDWIRTRITLNMDTFRPTIILSNVHRSRQRWSHFSASIRLWVQLFYSLLYYLTPHSLRFIMRVSTSHEAKWSVSRNLIF